MSMYPLRKKIKTPQHQQIADAKEDKSGIFKNDTNN